MAEKATIELVFDESGAIKAARLVDEALDKVGKTAKGAADLFDSSWARAAKNAASEFQQFASRTLANFAGNLLSNAVSSLKSGVGDFISTAAKESQDLIAAQRLLASVTREVGASYSEAEANAKAFADQMGVTTAAAEKLHAQALLTLQRAGNPAGIAPDQFLRSLSDLAAARGVSQGELPELLRGILENDESLNKLGLANPSTVIAQRAAAQGLSPGSLSEQQKNAEILRAVKEEGDRNFGAASGSLNSLGGILDRIGAKFLDLAAKVGEAFGRNQGIRALAEEALAAMERLSKNLENGALDGALKTIGATVGVIGKGILLWFEETRREFATAQFLIRDTSALLRSTFGPVIGELVAFASQQFQNLLGIVEQSLRAISGFALQFKGGDAISQGAYAAADAVKGARNAIAEQAGFIKADIATSAAEGSRDAADAVKTYRDEIKGVDADTERWSKTLDKLGRFDPVVKGLDATASAADKAREAVSALVDQLEDATKAGGDLFNEHAKILSARADNETRLDQIAGGVAVSGDYYNNLLGTSFAGPHTVYGKQADDIRRQQFLDAFGATPEDLGINLPGSDADRVARLFDVAHRAGDADNPNTSLYAAKFLVDKLAGTDLNTIARSGYLAEYTAALQRVDKDLGADEIEVKAKQRENTLKTNDILNQITDALKDSGVKPSEFFKSIPKLIEKLDKLPALATIVAKTTGSADIVSFAQAGDGEPYGFTPGIGTGGIQ